jgi:hypothetical protein
MYSKITSIFEIYPLLLFPLNKDKSHFSLGIIKTQIRRSDKQELKYVKF